ncbi:hypothetical protein [Vibrio coralliilyticus]|uniref:hypothetical protein n=1 Tax=Vibrio coralliilyticus TaxID=190893 RepID=UPI001E5CB2F0|nr:hypothetical protein [Vibrio coralliilyticus]MCC2525017.1 hypothetical protein [Vibrio coralliilyticus]
MKRALSLIACGIALATHTPIFAGSLPTNKPPISKRPKDTTEYSDYTSIRDKVYQPKEFTNHDDSVASRSNGQNPNGSRGGTAPDANVNPVNCSHPVYKNLCNEIKQLVANNAAAPISNLERKVAILECNTKPNTIHRQYHSGCYFFTVQTDYFWSNNRCASYTHTTQTGGCGNRKDD